MRLLTRKIMAKKAVETWKEKYQIHSRISPLEELGTNPDPDDVNRIVGNTCWTQVHCDECDKDVDEAVQVGEEPDYESATLTLCWDCVRKAWELIRFEEET